VNNDKRREKEGSKTGIDKYRIERWGQRHAHHPIISITHVWAHSDTNVYLILIYYLLTMVAIS